MQKMYALFDFDGTLRRGDSIISLCLYAHRRGLCHTGTLLRGMLAAVGYFVGLCTPERAKETAMSWIAGHSEAEMQALAQAFCLEKLVPQMYPQGLKALQEEQKRGAAVLLVTASPSFYLMPLKDLLGITEVIGTRMAVDDRGRYTGKICGENCRGVYKPLRLAEYLAATGDRLDYDTSSAYGDSASDGQMLQLCGRRYAVDPKRGLRRAMKKDEGIALLCWGKASRPA